MSKSFPGQKALDDFSIDIRPGEVHALVGENGSGKSTLIRCLAGYQAPDPGAAVEARGAPIEVPYSTAEAHARGLRFVHQDLGLVPSLTVAENLALGFGFETGRGSRIRWRREWQRVARLLEEFGHGEISPRAEVRSLSPSEQTIVAIVRGIQDVMEDGVLLVLDEPTASLPDAEAERLFDVIRSVQARGLGVMLTTHRLDEVFRLAGRVTVLRDGRSQGTFDVADLSEADLVTLIVGKTLELGRRLRPVPPAGGDVVLEAKSLCGPRVADFDLTLRAGEIVGIAGLLGSGRSELARLLSGAQRPTAGEVTLDGHAVRFASPREAIAAGVVLVPQDRRYMGSFQSLSLLENITAIQTGRYWRGGRFARGEERRAVGTLIEEFDVQPPRLSRRFGAFSGGNQQKAVIAKAMSVSPRLVVLDELTQGVDVGSRATIHELLVRQADAGAAALVISADFDDLVAICDRTLIMAEGRLRGELVGDRQTRPEISRRVYERVGTAA
ncbi:MAG TPA: sugar ABC transporter ATP-binding protein [Solirubrobacterales bacterium]|jgi:ABC-type sugar transport system ATPase subunit|nr:sugar ABC transporter ATP-binding protein [Solirubrobacterales bacterium]